MGRVKEMMMDWDFGIMHTFDKDKYVCTKHFDDTYINDYIKDNAHEGTCSYCGETHTDVLDMKSFMQYINERLSQRLCPLDDANLPLASSFYDDEEEEIPGFSRAGAFILPNQAEQYDDVQDVIYNYGLYTSNDQLNEDIESCFNEGGYTQADVFSEDKDKELSYAWDYFSKIVKNKKRYTFFQDPYFLRQEEWKDDVLTEINQICGKILVSQLLKGTVIYRGRPNDIGTPRTSFNELTAPPSEFAKENRMSATGISMFYGALDDKTPIQEIRNYTPDSIIDLGEFALKRDLWVIDLFKIPKYLSFWMPKYFREYKFLKNFHMEITKPIDKNPGIEYVPTQIFTEYIRFMNNYHIDGIIYRSSLTGGRNVVLFYDNETSADILQLNNITTI
ncbi:MAG: RES domain-containing protein [Bacteroidaceae bacterium]|nr:RES domain-containing protein [Bacteroidaceae bacterium]